MIRQPEPLAKYVIWSHEHDQWWRPGGSGYTPDLADAGRFPFDFAADIALHTLPPGIEIAVPEDVAQHGWEIHGANMQREPRRRSRG